MITETQEIADTAKDVIKQACGIITDEEKKSFCFGQSPIVAGYFVSMDGYVEYLGEENLKIISGNPDTISERAKKLVQNLRIGKRRDGDALRYNWLEVLEQSYYFLKSVLDEREPGMSKLIEEDVEKKDPELSKNRRRLLPILVNYISSYMREMS